MAAVVDPAFLETESKSGCVGEGGIGSSSAVVTAGAGMDITFHALSYTVPLKKKQEPKQVLKKISGICRAGEVCAIMGPTGGGKTSLLDCLAGRKDPKALSGHVLWGGKSQQQHSKAIAGYVVQEDICMGTLSVRENLAFSANLRLPRALSPAERAERVETTIAQLGLEKCADTYVGTEMIRGVSGGEKRRLNVGMELISNPKVLFLDEPTTGLDSTTAKNVVQLLVALAKRGRTIVLSIHQPRYSIFKLFDSVILLSAGELVYCGPSAAAVQYFETAGLFCERFNNPADFFLDAINGEIELTTPATESSENDQLLGGGSTDGTLPSSSTPVLIDSQNSMVSLKEGNRSNHHVKEGEVILDITSDGVASMNNKGAVLTQSGVALAEFWLASEPAKTMHSELATYIKAQHESCTDGNSKSVKRAGLETSFWTQVYYLGKRAILNLVRNPATSILQVVVMLIFGIITGLIYFQLKDNLEGLQNRVGATFFIIMNQIFGNLSAIELFLNERPIFVHEKTNGYYTTAAYFISKLFCDMLPMRVFPTILFATTVYFMMGFQLAASNFFIFVSALISTGVCAASLCFAVSSAVSVFAVANLLVALSYVFMMIFGGLLINLNSIPEPLRWIRFFSLYKWGYEAVVINEIDGLSFSCGDDNSTQYSGSAQVCPVQGSAYLDSQGIDPNNLGICFVGLWVMTTVFLLLAWRNLSKLSLK